MPTQAAVDHTRQTAYEALTKNKIPAHIVARILNIYAPSKVWSQMSLRDMGEAVLYKKYVPRYDYAGIIAAAEEAAKVASGIVRRNADTWDAFTHKLKTQ